MFRKKKERERRFIPIIISFYCISPSLCSCQRPRALQLKRGHLVTFTIDALKIVPAFIRHYVDSAYALVSPDTTFSRHSLDATANWRRRVLEDWRFQSFPMGSIECHERGFLSLEWASSALEHAPAKVRKIDGPERKREKGRRIEGIFYLHPKCRWTLKMFAPHMFQTFLDIYLENYRVMFSSIFFFLRRVLQPCKRFFN